jgi:hypothetical protein
MSARCKVPLTSVRGHQSDIEHAPWRGTRGRLFAVAAVGGAWLLARGPAARAFSRRLLTTLRVANDGAPFHGDGPLLTTLSPVRGRTAARLAFGLERHATVTLSILETGQGVASEKPSTVAETALRAKTVKLARGEHVLSWEPPTSLPPRTYIARISAQANREPLQSMHVVVRVLGVDAAFAGRSAVPGAPVTLVVRTDARTLTVQMLRSGAEAVPTYANNEIKGIPVGDPQTVDWRKHANAPAPIALTVGSDWATGIYTAQITADDGRVGFAPLVVHPVAPRPTRVAVVIPTSTWGAYNFYDADGDGWGDTWYARWHTTHVDLTRPHATRGVPYRYRSYDLAFQHWLSQTGKDVDMYADEDLEGFAPTDLRAAYDLLVFPGHTEYVSGALYNLVETYRDLGGNLMFLSANNFFRRVADRRVARPGTSRVEPARRAVRRKRQRPATRAVHNRRRGHRALGVRRHRPRQRVDVRQVRHRDRRALTVVQPGEHPGARDDHRPLRSRALRGDDVLRAPERREGVQCGRARLRRPDPALAGDAADPREPLAAPRVARRRARGSGRRALRSSKTDRSSHRRD